MWLLVAGFAVGFVAGSLRKRIMRLWREATRIDNVELVEAIRERSAEELKILREAIDEMLS